MIRPLFLCSAAVACLYAQDHLPSPLPEILRPPPTQTFLFQAHGTGVQVYTCKGAWTLKAPDAELIGADGQALGHHFAGPTWESKDGSRVVGKAVANVASPDSSSIPWLLVTALQHEGAGKMSDVVTIQRLNTKGGKAPADGCDAARAGAESRVPYEADYYFYGEKK